MGVVDFVRAGFVIMKSVIGFAAPEVLHMAGCYFPCAGFIIFWVIFSFAFRLCLASPQASFPKYSFCSMLRCPISGTHQLGNLYRSKEQIKSDQRRLDK